MDIVLELDIKLNMPPGPLGLAHKFTDLVFESEFDKLVYLKNIMKAAAGYVRDHLQTNMDNLPVVRSQTLSAIARAVWTQSIPLAETLLKHSGLARSHLKISEGVIYIADQANTE